MPIIIETGSGDDPEANSYASVEKLQTYAKLRGIDISHLSHQNCEALLIQAMDYLEAQRHRYKGRKTKDEQPLQWPRDDVHGLSVMGNVYPNDTIPRELEYGQLALAIEAMDGSLFERPLEPQVKKEKVEGAIELEYENPGNLDKVPALAHPKALLAPLYKRNGLTLVRS